MTGVLDAHVHLWDRAAHPQPWIDPASMAAIDRDFGVTDLAGMLAATGADAGVLVQSTNSLTETADLLALAAAAPIAAVVGWVDLTGDVREQVGRLRAGAGGGLLRGIRHLAHLEADPEWLLRPEVRRGLDTVEEEGLAFDLVVRAPQLSVAVQVARRHPGLRLVLDHLGNPPHGALPAWAGDLREIAAAPNVVAKLSGLITGVPGARWRLDDLTPAVEAAFATFGPDRLMYGSDWPVARLAHGGAVAWAEAVLALAAGLSEDERASLLSGTCSRGYRIPS